MRRSIQATMLVVATVTAYLVVVGTAVPAGALTATSVSPNALYPNTTTLVAITGSGFAVGDTVSVSGTGVTVGGTPTFVSSTEIDFNAVAAVGAAVADHDVTVTHPGGGLPPPLGPPDVVATCPACLQIIAANSVSPATGLPTSATPIGLTVTANHIRPAATLALVRRGLTLASTADATITATAVQSNGCVNGNCSGIQGSIVPLGRTPGVWDVVITNDNGTKVVIPASTGNIPFSLSDATPTFAATNALTPSQLGIGAGLPTPTPIHITGTNLFRGMKVTFLNGANPDTNFTQSGPVTWTDNQNVDVPVQIQSADTAGTRTVRVQNNPEGSPAGSTSAACTTICTITLTAGATVTSLNPTALGQGAAAIPVVITGTGFSTTGLPTVQFFVGSNPCVGVTVGAVAAGNTATSLTVPVTVSGTATPNQHCDVVVHNPDQGGIPTTTHPFTVDPAPSLTSSNPPSKAQGFVGNLILTGTAFHTTPTPTVSFSGTGMTVNTVTRDSATQLTANVTVAGNAPAGARDATVTNPDDHGVSTKTGIFTIVGGPTVTALAPGLVGQGAQHKVLHVTGTGFIASPLPTVSFDGTGVTVDASGVNNVTATGLDVTVSIRALNPPTTDTDVGNHAITVKNNDSNAGAGTLAGALTVTPAPQVSQALSPATAGQGATDWPITLTDNASGSNPGSTFQPNMTVAFSGTGITVKSVDVAANGVTATIVIDVAPNATTGARNMTMTNPDGGTSVDPADLTIAAAPAITTVSPTTPQSNSSPISAFVVNGTNLNAAAGIVLTRAGEPDIIGTNIDATGAPTQLKVDFPIDNPEGLSPAVRAAPGAWNVVVINPDGGQGSKANGLTISNAGPITVTGVSPNHLAQGGSATITVTGTNFAHGATANFGPNITVDPQSVTVLSVTQLTVDVIANLNAPNGPADVTITNTDNVSGLCHFCMGITDRPVIDEVAPQFVNPTGDVTDLVIFGSGFQSGATVQITGTVLDIVPDDAATEVSPDGTEMVVPITVQPNAERSARTVRVTNPDNGLGSCVNCLTVTDEGFWMVGGDGGIFSFPPDRFYGSTGSLVLNKPIVGMTATPSGKGYWFVASDGGIFSFGDAQFWGSTGSLRLNKPIVGMAATPTGNGYWLVASDGGIFAFGDAPFLGSTGSMHLNQPIVGMASTPTGEGYWLVAADGGIFTDDTVSGKHFGDAEFFGSAGGSKLNKPIVAMLATVTGGGYSFVASDGGVFNYGDAPILGSPAGVGVTAPVVGMARTLSGNGYWVAGNDGNVYNFGDAEDLGKLFGSHLNSPIVGIAPSN